jgi:hypothetical protein
MGLLIECVWRDRWIVPVGPALDFGTPYGRGVE